MLQGASLSLTATESKRLHKAVREAAKKREANERFENDPKVVSFLVRKATDEGCAYTNYEMLCYDFIVCIVSDNKDLVDAPVSTLVHELQHVLDNTPDAQQGANER